MKNIKYAIYLLPVLVILSGCSQKKDNYKEMAKAVCTCMEPLVDLYQKIQKLTAEGKTDELVEIMEEMEEVAEQAESCSEEVEEKYGDPEDEAKADEALRKVCPEVAAFFEDEEIGQR